MPVFSNMRPKRCLFNPPANSECLCGSGKKFKHCCSGNLPGFDIGKKASAEAKAGNYGKALLAYRADVTQYTIWHKTNTAPLLGRAVEALSPAVCNLLNIDIEALADRVESLSWCYEKLNRSDEFSAVLERLRSNIANPQWQRKIAYLQAVEAMRPNWDREAGRREFKKLGAMDHETDIEILQLYIDLFGEQLGLAQRQKFVDRIIQYTRNEGERLHYRALKAVDYLLVEDFKGAESELQAAIDSFSMVEEEYKDSEYAMSYYARAMGLLGNLKNDPTLWDKSIAISRKLLECNNWSPSGRAALYFQQGDILRCKAAWSEAKEAYLAANEECDEEVCKIFIAECLLYLDGPNAAQEIINTIVQERLNPSELTDYVFIKAVVAIQEGGRDSLNKAEQELRQLNISDPHFRARRDSLLVNVIDTLRCGPSSERTEDARSTLRSVLSTFLRYVKIEPNFMGLGLNVGKMLEDQLCKEQSKADSKGHKPKSS